MPGYVKVGKTTTTVEQRMRELDTSGVPVPFECFHAATVQDVNTVERRLHDAFGDHRIRKRREFFRIDPERVRSALLLAQINDVTPRDDVVEDADDQAALDTARKRRGPFNFEIVGIGTGSVLTFSKDQNITCTVIDNKYVEFDGERTSLSASALKILHDMGYTWKQVAGPDYWEYEGETLWAMRLRLEEDAD